MSVGLTTFTTFIGALPAALAVTAAAKTVRRPGGAAPQPPSGATDAALTQHLHVVTAGEKGQKGAKGGRRKGPPRVGISPDVRDRVSAAPPPGIPVKGIVVLDFDKCAYESDSHTKIILKGVRKLGRGLLKLVDNAPQRAWRGIQMTRDYYGHRLHPPDAARDTATLLEGLPILFGGREWAAAVAEKGGLKIAVLEYARERAREIVRQEWTAQQKTFDETGEEFKKEVQSRIYIVSSQFTEILKMLTEAGPEKRNILEIPPENIVGSEGKFEGDVFHPDGFFYCFGENKVSGLLERLKSQGIAHDSTTTVVMSDDHFYDGPLFMFARPVNRVLVDPDPEDAHYARAYGATVLSDSWDDLFLAHFRVAKNGNKPKAVGGEGTTSGAVDTADGAVGAGGGEAASEGGPARTEGSGAFALPGPTILAVDLNCRFFPDTRRTVSWHDAADRIAWGGLELAAATSVVDLTDKLLPEGLMESTGQTTLAGWMATAALAFGSAVLYGFPHKLKLGNRNPVTHLAVGAAVTAGMAAVHFGEFRPFRALLGGTAYVVAQFLATRSIYQPWASRLSRKSYGRGTRTSSFLTRIGVSSLWMGVIRLLSIA